MSSTSMVSRLAFRLAALVAGLAALLVALQCDRRRHTLLRPCPYVILISIDTLRADRLNCYGYTRRVTSPNVDALAREGILVETSIAAAPWTTPSHLSLLTSLPPSRHGVMASFVDMEHGLTVTGKYPRLADERLTLAEALRAHGYDTAAFTGGGTLDPRLGFGQGFQRYDTSMGKLGPRRMRTLFDWIDGHRQRPFFLFWHTFEVHAPYVAGDFLGEVLPAERARRLGRSLGRLARDAMEMPRPDNIQRGRDILREHGAFSREVCEALYDGGVLSADHWLGELLAFLRSRGLYDKTLLVFTSDHGEQLGERGRGFYHIHGTSMYEEMLHVPLILKLPGETRGGTRVAGVTSGLDVMPTILDVAEAWPDRNEMEGRSLRPLWDERARPGVPTPADALAFTEALYKGPEKKSVRAAREKLVLTVDPNETREHGRAFLPAGAARIELFDLVADPDELTNALDQPGVSEAIRERARVLEAALRSHLAGGAGRAAETSLDEGVLNRLRALGYAE